MALHVFIAETWLCSGELSNAYWLPCYPPFRTSSEAAMVALCKSKALLMHHHPSSRTIKTVDRPTSPYRGHTATLRL